MTADIGDVVLKWDGLSTLNIIVNQGYTTCGLCSTNDGKYSEIFLKCQLLCTISTVLYEITSVNDTLADGISVKKESSLLHHTRDK